MVAALSETLMRLLLSAPGRALLVSALLVLALGACGRRGPLEPPPDPSATPAQRQQAQAAADAEDDEDQEATTLPSPTPTPRRRSRAYTIPKEPFILDPLL